MGRHDPGKPIAQKAQGKIFMIDRQPNPDRRQKYFQLSSQLAQLDTPQLVAQFDTSEQSTSWGRHPILELDGTKIFVKRVPMTDMELKQPVLDREPV
jgi:hypothetical protein